MSELIAKCCQLKAKVVSKDEKESSYRAILNFGHTLGHAIEGITDFEKFKHGEAVAMGMVFASELSNNLDFAKEDYTNRLQNLLHAFSLPTAWPEFKTSEYRKYLTRDKKIKNQLIQFILAEKIGKVSIVPLSTQEIVRWL